MASKFQETVAMDFKEYYGRLILHLIELRTRLSALTLIPNKKETIIREIIRIWTAVYGSPQIISVENGGEVANDDLMQICDYLGINQHTTSAKSKWSNGIIERNNQALVNMMNKIINQSKYHNMGLKC